MSTPRSIRRCLNLLRFPVIAITMHCCFAAADLSAGTHASSQSADDAWTRALKTYKAKGAWGKTSLRAPELAKKASAHSVRATGQWFRLEVAEDGMVKIDAAYLRAQGVDPASLASIRDIKIFGGSGCALSTAPDARMGDELPQCAVFYADNNGNGRFNDDDYLLFYAQGSTGWDYDHEAGRFRHWINPYSSSNFYFLQIASSGTVKEMPMQQAPASAGSVVTGSVGKIFFDEDKFNFNQSGQMWVGAPMSGNGTTRLITNKLTGYAPGTPLIYRYDLFAQASVQSTFEISEVNAVIADVELPAMTIEEIKSTEGEFAREAVGEIAVDPKLPGDRSTVRMTYSAASSNAAGYINWLEIIYQKQLAASNDELTFTSPDQTGSVEYPVTGFSTNAVLGFDVTDLNNVKRLDLQLQQQMGTFRFRDNLTSGTVRSYWIGAPSAYHAPKSTVKLPPSNLHGTGPGAEFIIITHQDFKSEALRLKAHKEALPSGTALSTTVVDVDTIYNEFGNGTPDPTAIRNFIAHAYTHWAVRPQYVLLFGDASYNFRGLSGIERGWVPTYETVESNVRISSYCSDDYFVCVDSLQPGLPQLGLGRIPVRTIEEARRAVDRIIRYETRSSLGQWRNTITIVADDEWVGPDDLPEPQHTDQAESLAVAYTPQIFDIAKIYIAEYPTVITPQGRRKPDARQAIIDQVNRGTLLLNFTGHGNYTVWAHESILSLEDTKMPFSNDDKLPFVIAATCDWGRFDMTEYQSSAEEMMKNQNGGAIGVLSATRAVISADNASMNQTFYRYLLSENPFSPTPRLGDAVMQTKNDPGSGQRDNTAKYHLLCDPTLRLARPGLTMTIDSVNGAAVSDLKPALVGALQKVNVTAGVRAQDKTIDRTFNGTAIVTVFDAGTDAPLPNFSMTYKKQGAILYKGENSVVDGRLSASFIVPKDISYDSSNGRISVYFSSSSADGHGYTSNIIIAGTAGALTDDRQGPNVSVCFDAPSFRSGDVVGPEPTLIVALSDSSGINSTGTGIGHRIEAWIDGNPRSIDLTPYYRSRRDSYQEGTVEYRLPKMEEGMHNIAVKAWDVYNNPSTAEASFTVAPGGGLSIVNLFNFPNPAMRQTTFTFQHQQLAPVDVQIRIFTVAGRLVARLERFAISSRFVQIPWDCRDNDGDMLGNGVYFYQVRIKTADGSQSAEALGRLAIMR